MCFSHLHITIYCASTKQGHPDTRIWPTRHLWWIKCSSSCKGPAWNSVKWTHELKVAFIF
jgi:hypothetical protein